MSIKERETCVYWYKQSQIIDQLEKEAGWKENIQYSLMGAIVMLFLGSGISSVSKRWNVPEEEITEALQNDYIVNEAKRIVSEIQTQNPSQATEASFRAPALINCQLLVCCPIFTFTTARSARN